MAEEKKPEKAKANHPDNKDGVVQVGVLDSDGVAKYVTLDQLAAQIRPLLGIEKLQAEAVLKGGDLDD